jgi:recombination protein RecT
MEAAQLIRDALTCLRTTRKLAECERLSVLGGLMTCAQLGLRPGIPALGHAWLLPFWDGRDRCHKAQLVIGYQGYVELAYRSGRVLSIAARTVYTQDDFELEYGLVEDVMRHRPARDGLRGEPRLYYAASRLKDGGYALTDPMSHAEMEAHRDRYAMARNKEGRIVGPWVDQFEAMAHKTMIRRLAKLLPKSTEMGIALAVDDGLRIDLTPNAAADEVTDHPVIDVAPEQEQEPAAEAAEPPPEPPAATGPGQNAMRGLHAAAGKLGLGDDDRREDRLAVFSDLLSRPVASSNELTGAQAEQVARLLRNTARQPPEDQTLTVAEMVERGRKIRAGAEPTHAGIAADADDVG